MAGPTRLAAIQTSFWRLNSALPCAQFHWLSVDFAAVIELRKRLLPHSERIALLAHAEYAKRFPGGQMIFDPPPDHRQEGRSEGAAFVQALQSATLFPAFWNFEPTKQFRGAYTQLEFG